MADSKTSTILEFKVDINKTLDEIASLNVKLDDQKNKIKELNDQYKGQAKDESYYKQLTQLKEQTKDYNDQIRSLTKSIENEKKSQDQNKDSVVSLRAQLSNLTKQYDQLSAAERNSADGREIQKKISGVYNELKKAEEETGRFQRNVGNYGQKMVDAFQGAGGAASSMINPIKNVTMGLKTMSATPAIAILSLLANVINAVIKGLKSSEDSMERVQIALAPLNAASTLFTNVLQGLARNVASVVEWLNKMADRLGLLTDKMKLEQELTKSEIELEQKRRQYNVQNSKDEIELSELRTKSQQKSLYSAKERAEFIKRAGEIERTIATRNIELAKEEVRIAEERSAQADNSSAENDRLAQAYQNLNTAQQQYYDRTRRLDLQEDNLNKTTTSLVKTLGEMAEIEIPDDIEIATPSFDDAVKEIEDYYKRVADLRKQELANRIALADKDSQEYVDLQKQQLENERVIAENELQMKGGTYEQLMLLRQTYLQKEAELDIKYKAEERKRDEEQVKAKQAATMAVAGAIGQLSSIMAEAGEQNKTLTALSKTLALAQIAIESGVATAKGIAQAQSVPYPANIAAVATTIATILSGITSAVSSVKAAKFATGGKVRGAGTGTSDSIPARLSNGEFVINAGSTAMYEPLLTAINSVGNNSGRTDSAGGFAYLASAIAAGMKSADLSVSVDEIHSVEDRLTRIDAISEL